MRDGSSWPDARASVAAAIRNPQTALPRCWMGKHRTRSGIVRGVARAGARDQDRRRHQGVAGVQRRRLPGGSGRVYETLAGRAFGELDPNDPHNTIIQDIQLAPRNADGKVEYSATFFLVKPIDMSKSSHLMWQDVPNRGGRITIPVLSRNDGDIGLSSGWQGDNSGDTAQVPAPGNTTTMWSCRCRDYADGSPVTGTVMGRIVNRERRQLARRSSSTRIRSRTSRRRSTRRKRRSTYHDHESNTGVVTGVHPVAAADWAWAKCSAANPFPGTPDPTQICVSGGFDPNKVYQVVFTVEGSVRPGDRLRGVPRRGVVLQVSRRPTTSATRIRWPTASSGSSRAAARSRATSCAS